MIEQSRVAVMEVPVAGTVRAERRYLVAGRVSWGAIFAGTFVAFASQLLFTVLGLAVGLTAADVAAADPIAGLGMGAAVWWFVTGLVSLFLGGVVAGRMAEIPRWVHGMLHGALVWCVVTVVSLLLLTTAVGSLVGGALGIVREGVITPAGEVGVAEPRPRAGEIGRRAAWTTILAEANQLAIPSEEVTPGVGAMDVQRGELEELVSDVVRTPAEGGVASPQSEQRLTEVLMTNAEMSRREADQTIQSWRESYETGEPDITGAIARTTPEGEEATAQATAAAWWSFFALLLGVCAAGAGGAIAIPRYKETVVTRTVEATPRT